MTVAIHFTEIMERCAAQIAAYAKERRVNVEDLHAVMDATLYPIGYIVHYDTYEGCVEYRDYLIEQDPFCEDYVFFYSYDALQDAKDPKWEDDFYTLVSVELYEGKQMSLSIKFSDFRELCEAQIAYKLKEKRKSVEDLYAVVDHALGNSPLVVSLGSCNDCYDYRRALIGQDECLRDRYEVMSYCKLQAIVDDVYITLHI